LAADFISATGFKAPPILTLVLAIKSSGSNLAGVSRNMDCFKFRVNYETKRQPIRQRFSSLSLAYYDHSNGKGTGFRRNFGFQNHVSMLVLDDFRQILV
jgi:hypothetical protein